MNDGVQSSPATAGRVSPPRPENDHYATPLEFTGSASEFFPIWIVNALLTLATFGIYASWAKVRRKRYFYGHTRVLGHSFDYTANPGALLLGNAIVVALFFAYAVFGRVYPAVRVGALVVAAFVLPWLVVRALRFNARNTIHRGIPFRFDADYFEASGPYFGGLLVSGLTAGIAYPYYVFTRIAFAVNHLRFGNLSFKFTGSARPVYGIYVRGWLCCGALLAGWLGVSFLIIKHALSLDSRGLYVTSGGAVLILLATRSFIDARLFNYRWRHVVVNGHRFEASLSASRLLYLQFWNLLAIVSTAGLAAPWAMIRTTRYRLSCLQFVPGESLDTVVTDTEVGRGALGDAATEYFGVDVGL